jgi:hypothetical protein
MCEHDFTHDFKLHYRVMPCDDIMHHDGKD